ncbi:MAG: hypothetical protein U0136_15575 [Bdellovibrionota bacterium]
MSQDAQLQVLLKTCEVEEQRALQRKREIERVLAERQRVADDLQQRRDTLLVKIRELGGEQRVSALRDQNIAQVLSITQYVERMRRSVRELEKQLVEQNQELQRAQERDTLAEKEVIGARLERRRIEKLIEGRHVEQLVKGSAVEESLADELSATHAAKRNERSGNV